MIRLLLNLGCRHPVLPGDADKLTAGSKHSLDAKVEHELVRLGHAEFVGKPKSLPKEKAIEAIPDPDQMLKTEPDDSSDLFDSPAPKRKTKTKTPSEDS